MKRYMACALMTGILLLTGLLSSPISARAADADGVTVVPTFHCLSLYWSPAGGAPDRGVNVRFRKAGGGRWREGHPLRHHPIDSPECGGDYRGSLVNLTPGTTYEIALTLECTGERAETRGTTWSETFPVASTVGVDDREATLTIDRSGSPGGYVLYDGTGCTIDTGNTEDVGIAVRAHHVILRGFTIKNVKEHGIRIFDGHDIIIEDCDISGWGTEDEKGWGKNYQACVYSNNEALKTVVIQRCRFHHPTWDTNSWAEKHGRSTHPAGPQTIVFWNSGGNHVFRYNECFSEEDHYYNDAMGAGSNASHRGFPGSDSDIYCNYVADCWDDGIEAEGNNQNVRIWNNYVEDVLIAIANAATSIGPLYVWRNVSGRSYSPPGSSWDMTHGPMVKMGFANGEQWMTGHMYFFNNTIFQEGDNGAGGLGGGGRIIKHCVTRNNILHVRSTDSRSIAVSDSHADNDFDHDMLSAGHPEGHEEHGIRAEPRYAAGAGFDTETRTGMFQLEAGSAGVDAGVVIPNFCEAVDGNPPDMGAHERGTGRMRFGVEAAFNPPGY